MEITSQVESKKVEKAGLLTVSPINGDVDESNYVYSNVSLRMDRLPWSRWHWLVACSLGVSWIMDGLIVSSLALIGSKLLLPTTLNLTTTQVGWSASSYLTGAVLGSLLFGYLADRYGRRKLFIVTPTIYLFASQACAFAWNFYSLVICTFFIGLGIGGEYSAMNSAINEFIPAKIRGMVDLAINGSYWLGAALGSVLALIFLRDDWFWPQYGWRFPFAIAGIVGISIIVMRFRLPESPRWLLLHGYTAEADKLVSQIEEKIEKEKNIQLPPVEQQQRLPVTNSTIGFRFIIVKMLTTYRKRSILGLCLMIAQAFFYNAIFFTYATILTTYYGVLPENVGLFELPFCLGNFLGSALLGPLFDFWGRKPMITSTYMISAILLTLTGFFFWMEWLTAITQTIAWSVIFFVSSASASAAYLTVSEIFPLQIRALSIAFFYSVGTGTGGNREIFSLD
jgi:MFS family permease